MDSLLKSKKMTLVESRKNEEDVIHDNRILGFREGVAVLDVCADKKEFYWSNFKENEIHNQPFCKVIIDNRPNRGFLLWKNLESSAAKEDRTRWWLFCVIISTGWRINMAGIW